jgi:4-hydroxy-tetrahydrodipicolinate reductase
MNIAIIGYGKMGKTIEKIAKSRGHVISTIIEATNHADLEKLGSMKVHAAIEFTQPSTAYDNIITCFNQDIPVVCGTTGWTERLPEVEQACDRMNGSFLYASNFSLGVNLFFEFNKKMAALMSGYPDYKVTMSETHHTEKKDTPSGTAITLANSIIDNHKAYNGWSEESGLDNEIIINSFREKDINGIHEINYVSDHDEISLKHTARNRDGFALGAVIAAEWLADKQGIYTMKDLLNF